MCYDKPGMDNKESLTSDHYQFVHRNKTSHNQKKNKNKKPCCTDLPFYPCGCIYIYIYIYITILYTLHYTCTKRYST